MIRPICDYRDALGRLVSGRNARLNWPTRDDDDDFLIAEALDYLEKWRGSAISSVITERTRQDAKWGEQNHDPTVWMGILMEEVGELAQAVNETWFDNGEAERAKGGYLNMRAEAVQVAAVAVALVECLDRRHGVVMK